MQQEVPEQKDQGPQGPVEAGLEEAKPVEAEWEEAKPVEGTPEEALTLLVVLAHPDDEIGAVAAMLAQRARGDRVVLCWLTRGEMTEAFGPVSTEEVIARRLETGRAAGNILGVDTRFLKFPDTGVTVTREGSLEVARLITDVRPDGIVTWGDAWIRGMRHPDHQATGRIVRAAVTLARIQKCVAPAAPHRSPVPVFTFRDAHSTLPAVAIDATPYMDKAHELGRLYYEALEFPDPDWLENRFRTVGRRWGLEYAEEFDAWESEPGVVEALLPARRDGHPYHPEREAGRELGNEAEGEFGNEAEGDLGSEPSDGSAAAASDRSRSTT